MAELWPLCTTVPRIRENACNYSERNKSLINGGDDNDNSWDSAMEWKGSFWPTALEKWALSFEGFAKPASRTLGHGLGGRDQAMERKCRGDGSSSHPGTGSR